MKINSPHKNWADLLNWLQENVGPILHSQPIMFWHGDGWHLRRLVDLEATHDRWEVEINDEKKATLFALRWS